MSLTYHFPFSGYRVRASMLRASPEALVLLGALLTGRLNPAGKYQVSLAARCYPAGM